MRLKGREYAQPPVLRTYWELLCISCYTHALSTADPVADHGGGLRHVRFEYGCRGPGSPVGRPSRAATHTLIYGAPQGGGVYAATPGDPYAGGITIANSGTASAPIVFEAAGSPYEISGGYNGLTVRGDYVQVRGADVVGARFAGYLRGAGRRRVGRRCREQYDLHRRRMRNRDRRHQRGHGSRGDRHDHRRGHERDRHRPDGGRRRHGLSGRRAARCGVIPAWS